MFFFKKQNLPLQHLEFTGLMKFMIGLRPLKNSHTNSTTYLFKNETHVNICIKNVLYILCIYYGYNVNITYLFTIIKWNSKSAAILLPCCCTVIISSLLFMSNIRYHLVVLNILSDINEFKRKCGIIINSIRIYIYITNMVQA